MSNFESTVVNFEDEAIRRRPVGTGRVEPEVERPKATKKVEKTITCRDRAPIVRVVRRGGGIGLISIIALLALRHFVPEAATSLSGVYQLLDSVVLPVINWAAKAAVRLIKAIAALPPIEYAIGVLKNLV